MTDVSDDADFAAFVQSVTGQAEQPATTEGADDGAMPVQPAVDNDSGQSATPDADKAGEATTQQSDEQQGKQDADDGEADPLANYVPREVVRKVRHERREAVREREQFRKERDQFQQEAAQLRQQMEHFQQQGKAHGVELKPMATEISDELIQAVGEGDPTATAEALRIMRGMVGKQAAHKPPAERQTVQQERPAEHGSASGHWTESLQDDGVRDTLEEWSETAEAGDQAAQKRWAIAVEVSKAVMTDPANRTLEPDDIGRKVVSLTNQKVREAAAARINQQGREQARMPESLSSSPGGRNHAPAGADSLLGLSGDDLIAALDNLR